MNESLVIGYCRRNVAVVDCNGRIVVGSSLVVVRLGGNLYLVEYLCLYLYLCLVDNLCLSVVVEIVGDGNGEKRMVQVLYKLGGLVESWLWWLSLQSEMGCTYGLKLGLVSIVQMVFLFGNVEGL